MVASSQHAVLACVRLEAERRRTELQIGGTLTTESIVGGMLEGARNWNVIYRLLRTVMSRREADERVKHKCTVRN